MNLKQEANHKNEAILISLMGRERKEEGGRGYMEKEEIKETEYVDLVEKYYQLALKRGVSPYNIIHGLKVLFVKSLM